MSDCHPQAEDESHSFTLTSETNTATVTQLSPGHIYGFQVRARTAAGHGPYGGKVYFQTLPPGEGASMEAVALRVVRRGPGALQAGACEERCGQAPAFGSGWLGGFMVGMLVKAHLRP